MKKYNYATLIIGFLLFNSSCKKDNGQDNQTTQKSKEEIIIPLKSGGGTPIYKNPLNPYDTLGQVHNDIALYIMGTQSSWSSPIQDEIIGASMDYGNTNFGLSYYDMQTAITADTNRFRTYMNNNGNDFGLVINDMISDWPGSTVAKTYLQSLFSTVLSYEDSTDLSSLMTSIKTIENNFASDFSVSTTEKANLYCVASILRHSAYLWDQQYPFGSYGEPDVYLFKRFGEWLQAKWTKVLQVVCADAITYIRSTIILPPTSPISEGVRLVFSAAVSVGTGLL